MRPDPAEAVVVVGYDSQWPSLFEQESRRVAGALGEAVVAVEHIGSTAVPGLAAKPVVDMLAGLRTLALPTGAVDAMDELGFRKGRPRTHHVHAVLVGSDLWDRHLAFRDYLRARADEADDYAEFKRRLVHDVDGDRDRYVDGKEAYAAALERRARSWKRGLGSVGT